MLRSTSVAPRWSARKTALSPNAMIGSPGARSCTAFSWPTICLSVPAVAARAFGTEHDRRQTPVRAGHDAGVLARVDDDRLPAAALELVLDLAQPHTGHRLRGHVAVGDQDGKALLELHASLSRSMLLPCHSARRPPDVGG